MKIAVCDDCYEDALYLKTLLEGQSVWIYSDSDCLILDIKENSRQYDLYFLDIFMEDSMNGIDLARLVRQQDEEAVICFISSSNEFYREAYDLYAVQYLLKPVQAEEVHNLLDRVSKSLLRNRERSLCFKWRGQTGTIPYGNILFISSSEHTVFIYCKNGVVQECKGKLSEIALQAGGDVFMRCHQSFLVNMYQVDSLKGNELMVSGHPIPISRRYYTEVKRRYQEILFEEVD